jgi:uncharacterized lipoprotein YajG
MKTLLLLIPSLLLLGCSTPYPLNYAPSNTYEGHLDIADIQVRYLPADTRAVAANQAQKRHPSIGELYFSEDISVLVQDALRKELRLSGYSLGKPNAVNISCRVQRFYCDWVGFASISAEVALEMSISKEENVVYNASFSSRKSSPKLEGQEPEVIKAALAHCVSQFIGSAKQAGVL